ncbi:MAG: glycosyltransferase family 4 protein [Lentisphaerae bacterium]|nr:glycosyltransferase family 4 protein [Lentisphaerota bacterium]
MKILFFSHYYTPEGNAPATRVSALCERWVKSGHDVTVVTCPPNVPNGIVYDGYANRRTSEVINGVKVERVKLYIAANKGAVKRMFNFVSYFVKSLLAALRLPKPDVVIATSPQIFCGYAGVWYKRLRHVPLVIEIRDIWPESMGAVGANIPKLAYWGLEKVEKAMYRTCDALVTVGEGYRSRLLEKGIPESKMSIVMNGTDLAVYKPQPKNEDLLARYGLEGKFVVSYIGTVGMACGLEVVLDAAEIISRKERKDRKVVVFVIVGDGAHREKLEAEAKSRGLANVVFTGRQPKTSMPDWVSSSDANLVHLKKTELFTTVMPSKIFESAGCKRPIIMGVDGFAKKLVMDAHAGLDMTPENADSLVECVEKLVGDPELCKQLGENAYNNIAKVHNRDKQAEEYLKVLKELH